MDNYRPRQILKNRYKFQKRYKLPGVYHEEIFLKISTDLQLLSELKNY